MAVSNDRGIAGIAPADPPYDREARENARTAASVMMTAV
jgi:hypothetical protein